MALKDIWTDLVNGVSEIDADDINNIRLCGSIDASLME